MKRHKPKKVELPVLANKYNVSYLGSDSTRPPFRVAVRHYISAAIVYGTALLIITFSPYFRRLLDVQFYG
ncbi:MAG: hypothetical protein P8016_08980, partial [Sedimentisphaerales bacterium]